MWRRSGSGARNRGWGQVLRRASFPVIAVFRYTVRRFSRRIGEHFGIDYTRVSRIESNSERQRARGKT